MNMQEFAALKIGDKIENHFSKSQAEVVETTDSGVRLVWGEFNGAVRTPFFYSVNSTAWMHWSKL